MTEPNVGTRKRASDARRAPSNRDEKRHHQQAPDPALRFRNIITSTAIFSFAVVGFAIFTPDAWRVALGGALDGLSKVMRVRPSLQFGKVDGPELLLNVSSCPGELCDP